MTIRPAEREDIDRLQVLWDEGRKQFDRAPEIMRDGTFADLVARVERGNVIVAEHGGEIIGMVSFDIQGKTYVGTCVAVAPAWRRNGIGRSLILSAHELAKKKGARQAAAVQWVGHPHLEHFYDSVGYTPAGTLLNKELR